VSSLGSDSAPDGLEAKAAATSKLTAMPLEAKARLSRMRMLIVLGGLLAGLVSFGVGETIYKMIAPEHVPQTFVEFGVRHVIAPSPETERVADAQNGALAFGALGLCLGGFLGIAGGLARRSTFGAVTGGLVGVVLGAALGAGVSRAVLPPILKAVEDYWADGFSVYSLLVPVATHGLIWGLVGASAGLALAVGLGERRLVSHALMAGLVGAVLGSIAFDLIGATYFLGGGTDKPISHTWPTRLMARLLVTIGTAVALVLFLPAPRDVVAKHRADAT